jgi:hypothetical protein
LHEEGAHLRRGAHHHLGGGFLERRRLLQRETQNEVKFKGKARAKAKQRYQDKDKANKAKKGSPRQGVPYFTRLVGRYSRKLQGIHEWLLLYQVHFCMFIVLSIFL